MDARTGLEGPFQVVLAAQAPNRSVFKKEEGVIRRGTFRALSKKKPLRVHPPPPR